MNYEGPEFLSQLDIKRSFRNQIQCPLWANKSVRKSQAPVSNRHKTWPFRLSFSQEKGPLFVVRDLSTWLSGDRRVEERGLGQLDCGVACSYIDMDAPLKIGNRSWLGVFVDCELHLMASSIVIMTIICHVVLAIDFIVNCQLSIVNLICRCRTGSKNGGRNCAVFVSSRLFA